MTDRPSRLLAAGAVALALALLADPASAQGRGRGQGGGPPAGTPGAAARAQAPGQAKKRVTHDDAVTVSREILVAQGYRIERVERVGDTRVIHYYRGNNGNGRGRGPLERIVVRPDADRFAFDGAPREVLAQLRVRLGF